jgi:hypothetical protein
MKVLKIGHSNARHAITLIRGFSKAHNNNGEQRARIIGEWLQAEARFLA